MIPRREVFPHVIEMNYQARRRLGCCVYLVYDGADWLLIDIGYDDTVEEIVDDLHAPPNSVVLPSWIVGAVCEVPGGAFPSYAQGYYKRDNSVYKDWDASARDRDTFRAWIKANVLEQGPEVFAAQVSKHKVAAD